MQAIEDSGNLVSGFDDSLQSICKQDLASFVPQGVPLPRAGLTDPRAMFVALPRGDQVSDIRYAEFVQAADNRNPQPRDQLFVSLYDALWQMAKRELRRGAAVTLTPTVLLHETYLNISQRDSVAFSDHGKFMSYAGRAMRGLIVDYLRNRHTRKRGSEFQITSLPAELPNAPAALDGHASRIDDLSTALESLEKIDARLAQCVDLRFFCGFSFPEIARLRDVSERTVQRDWDKARLLLRRIIEQQEPDCPAIS